MLLSLLPRNTRNVECRGLLFSTEVEFIARPVQALFHFWFQSFPSPPPPSTFSPLSLSFSQYMTGEMACSSPPRFPFFLHFAPRKLGRRRLRAAFSAPCSNVPMFQAPVQRSGSKSARLFLEQRPLPPAPVTMANESNFGHLSLRRRARTSNLRLLVPSP